MKHRKINNVNKYKKKFHLHSISCSFVTFAINISIHKEKHTVVSLEENAQYFNFTQLNFKMRERKHFLGYHPTDSATSAERRHYFREVWRYTAGTWSVTGGFLNSHWNCHFLSGALKVSLGTAGSVGYLSLLCCSAFQISDDCIFYIGSFPYRREVTECVRLQVGNPLRFSPREKNLALRLCPDVYIKVILTHNKSKRQEIHQEIAVLKVACFESWCLCSALFSKLASWRRGCCLIQFVLDSCTERKTVTSLCFITSTFLLTVAAILQGLVILPIT